MSEDNSLPRATVEIEFIRPVLKQIKSGRDPHEIETALSNQDINITVKKLKEFGLIDHVSVVAALQKQARAGNYYLTEKGVRWLRTYDSWERFKHGVSKFQFVWGVILGVSINMLSNLIWSFVS